MQGCEKQLWPSGPNERKGVRARRGGSVRNSHRLLTK